MKKIWFILLILFLVGCNNNPLEMTTSDESTPEVIEQDLGDGLWYQGKVGEETIRLQFSQLEGVLVGRVEFRGSEVTLRGKLYDDIHTFISDDIHLEFVKENEQLLGVFIYEEQVMPLQMIKDNQVFKEIGISERALLMTGTYQGLKSTEFLGSSLTVTPLFDHLILVELKGYNGLSNGAYTFMAVSDGNSFTRMNPVKMTINFTEHHEVHLFTNDFTYGCDEDVSYDNRYSESYKVPVLSLIQKGVVQTRADDQTMKRLLGEDYNLLSKYAQYITPIESDIYEGYTLGIHGFQDVITVLEYNEKYYVHFDGRLFDGKGKWYTNELGDLPNLTRAWRNDESIIVPMTTGGFKTVFTGDGILDFIPEDFFIKDRVKGNINKDSIQDELLILESEDGLMRVLLILKGTLTGYDLEIVNDTSVYTASEGGIFGDPFDDMTIEDGVLMLSFYGGSNDRWGQKYFFDTYHDYQMIKHVTYTYNTDDLIVTTFDYDMVDGKVIRTIEDEANSVDTLFRKRLIETIYLADFNIYEGIDLRYD